MTRIIVYLSLLCCSFALNAQQDLGLHFMRDLYQSNLSNPALFNRYKINVALPSAYGHLSNSSFAISDVSRLEGSTLNINMEELIERLDPEKNLLQTNVDIHTLAVGLQFKNTQITLSHAVKFNSYFNYTRGMVELFWGGNGASVGQTIDIAPALHLMGYQEIALGVAHRLNNFVSIGGRFKYLNGIGAIHTERAQASIYTDPEYYQLTAETDYLIHSAGVPLTIGGQGDFLEIGDFEPQIFGDNRGFALDLGATFQIGDRISITASALDLGQINWKTDPLNLKSRGNFEFDGLDIEPLVEEEDFDFSQVMDTIKETFRFTETREGFSTALPGKYYLSGTIRLMKNWQLGALIYGESFGEHFSPALAFSARKEFGKIFSFGAVYSLRNHSFNNLGLNMALRLAGIQLFALSDNVLAVFDPLKSKNANVRIGLNLAFGS